ncbi:MAG: NAD(P)/FAD-dependent oxidoreductase [Anaerolineae bacterium]|nr:NAD(P)/FAD-dependent oxidoreductase [Anaerolineae bacterium]
MDTSTDVHIEPAYDAIVVGAGPVGSLTAQLMAQAGLRVALLEEHPAVGQPDHCSGLVSPRTLRLAGLEGQIPCLAAFREARVWGPPGGSGGTVGKTLWLRSPSVQAIAVDRAAFDRLLADRAVEAGAQLMLDARATGFSRTASGVRVDVQLGPPGGARTVHLQAALLIGADGAHSRVARWVGRPPARETIPAIKAEVRFADPATEAVEIFVGRQMAPGWFAWLIPLPGGVARIGLGATHGVRGYYERFVAQLRARFGPMEISKPMGGILPLGPARGFVVERVMLAGAAANQTKPTTGGGIYFGLRAAHLAATTAVQAIGRGDCSLKVLSAYEQAWQRKMGPELRTNHWLRQGFRALSDGEFNLLLSLLARPAMQRQIARLGDIDYPSTLFSALIRTRGKGNQGLGAREKGQAPADWRALEVGD